jgi:hypothetical protein
MKRGVIAAFVLLGVVQGSVAAGPIERFGFLCGSTSTNRELAQEMRAFFDTHPARGWLLGGYVQWSTPVRPLSVTNEVLYLEKGYSRHVGTYDEGTDDEYLSLPLLATYEPVHGPWTPYVFGGPSLEILTADPGDRGRANMGLHVGGGIRWRNFELDARYIHDLTAATGGDRAGYGEVKNRGFAVAFGVGIDVPHEP